MHVVNNIAAHHTFRHRLMGTMGPALTIAMILIGMFAWIFFYGWLTYSSQATLALEIREVSNSIIQNDGTLEPEAYYWDEPHHRYDTQHIDPYFLQVFDTNGYLLRSSDNIDFFPPRAYPSRLLPYHTSLDNPIQRLRMFEVASATLYYRTSPIYNSTNQLVGYVQVARYDPGIRAIMTRMSIIVLVALVPILCGLLGLVWWSARRVVAPLEAITKEAQFLSPHHLSHRINIPANSDRETELLAQTLNEQLGRLEQTFEEMKRFTADAAHELKTPLTILKGHISLAMRRDRTVEEYKTTLNILHDQTEGLIKLAQSLLLLARLDETEETITTEELDLVPLVRKAISPFKHQAMTKDLDFSSSMPQSARIQGHSDMLHEVVTNLCDNAVKYTHEGAIHVEVCDQGDQVILSVKDSGEGMTPEVLNHATDRFFRSVSSNANRIPGSGLGLALVKRITKQLGGKLEIDSLPYQGTTVTIRFPAL